MKRVFAAVCAVCLACLVIVSCYFIERFSYSKEYAYFDTREIVLDSMLTVGVIGDSWTSHKALDSILVRSFEGKGISLRVVSSGHPGARTKKIYQNLFEGENIYSSRFVIEEHPDYCVVVAGVNDAASQIGAENYAYHMIRIIKTLLHYCIRPVIVTLPEFGIIEYTNGRPFFTRVRNKLSAWFDNTEIDNIAAYRSTFYENLASEGLTDSVLIVDFDNICEDYGRHINLYRNTSHLSQEGNQRLVDEISRVIMDDIRR